MEVGNKFGSMRELRYREPRGFLIRTFVTSPLNQVQELAFVSLVYLGIEDRGYFIFQFPINDDRRVRDGVPTRERIQS